MGMGQMQDYYDILNVPRTAGDDDLRRAYKKLAMRWHPDKHPTESKRVVEAKFKQICEAYGVLSDSNKRQIYDLYGEDGLKSGYYDVSSPSAAAAPRAGGGVGLRKGTSFKYSPRGDDDILADFFGDAGGGGGSRSPGSENGGRSKSDRTAEKKAAAVENRLACTLEELYKGSKRKMMISRIVPDDSG